MNECRAYCILLFKWKEKYLPIDVILNVSSMKEKKCANIQIYLYIEVFVIQFL